MTQITEDYVSYDIAKLLKEKGFKNFTTIGWSSVDHIKEPRRFIPDNGRGGWYDDKKEWISRPSLSLVMKWLREVHHCVICVTPLTFYCGETVSKWGYCIWADDNIEVDEESSPRLESYEEACEAAIKYCLENII